MTPVVIELVRADEVSYERETANRPRNTRCRIPADYVLALIVALALVVFGFYTSLAGEPLFRGSLPDD